MGGDAGTGRAARCTLPMHRAACERRLVLSQRAVRGIAAEYGGGEMEGYFGRRGRYLVGA